MLRNARTKYVQAVVCEVIGYTLIASIDWRIAVGVFLLMLASNLMRSADSLLEKLKV